MSDVTINIVAPTGTEEIPGSIAAPGGVETPGSIAVPDTGVFNSMQGIALISFASLIIIAAIALIVRGRLKYRQINISRIFKTNLPKLLSKKKTIASLSIVALVASISAFAILSNSTNNNQASAVEDEQVLSITTEDVNITTELGDEAVYAETMSTVTVNTPTPRGYTLSAYATGTDLYLDGNTSSENVIHGLTSTENTTLGNNTWGISLTNPDNQSSAVFKGIPTTADNPITMKMALDATPENDTTNFYYGAYVAPGLEYGTYSGVTINYVAVSSPKTIDVTYDSSGFGFADGSNTNVVKYRNDCQHVYKSNTPAAISKTPNIGDDGVANTAYGSNLNTTDTVTVAGADKLVVELDYETDYYYDNVTVYEGDINGTLLNIYRGSAGYPDPFNSTTFYLDGDTVTFAFFSDSYFGNYYGYYAKVYPIYNTEQADTTRIDVSCVASRYSPNYQTPNRWTGWFIEVDGYSTLFPNENDIIKYINENNEKFQNEGLVVRAGNAKADITYNGNGLVFEDGSTEKTVTYGADCNTGFISNNPTITLTEADVEKNSKDTKEFDIPGAKGVSIIASSYDLHWKSSISTKGYYNTADGLEEITLSLRGKDDGMVYDSGTFTLSFNINDSDTFTVEIYPIYDEEQLDTTETIIDCNVVVRSGSYEEPIGYHGNWYQEPYYTGGSRYYFANESSVINNIHRTVAYESNVFSQTIYAYNPYINVTYHGNGLPFADGEDTNTTTYSMNGGYKGTTHTISKSPNIDDDGNASEGYMTEYYHGSEGWSETITEDVITFPSAKKLIVELNYGMRSDDCVLISKMGTSGYERLDSYCGKSNGLNPGASITLEAIDSDTVKIDFYRLDTLRPINTNNYGYYAKVYPVYDTKQDDTELISCSTMCRDSGIYKTPIIDHETEWYAEIQPRYYWEPVEIVRFADENAIMEYLSNHAEELEETGLDVYSDNPYVIRYNGNGATAGTMDGFATVIGDTEGNLTSFYTVNILGETLTQEVSLLAPNFKKDGYGFAGWSKDPNATVGGSSVIYGPNQYITHDDITISDFNEDRTATLYAVWVPTAGELQNWTGCSAMNIGDVTALTDNRDNNVYTVAKLADGECWMTENLRLDDTATLTAENTDNPLISNLSASSDSWCGKHNETCINQSKLNTNNINIGGFNSDGKKLVPYPYVKQADAFYPQGTYHMQWYSYGNLYNWYSATAGTGTYDTGIGDEDAQREEAAGSICPAGWRLPVGTVSRANWILAKSFANLNKYLGTKVYGIPSENTYTGGQWLSYPNNFVLGGNFTSSGSYARHNSGDYWSSTANMDRYAFVLDLYGPYARPKKTLAGKYLGHSVRCIYAY